MSDIPLHETRMGRTLLEKHVPEIVAALQQIATELRTLNQHLECKPDRGEPDDPQG